MTINLNMFGHFMKDEIVCNLNITLIVTIYKNGTKKKSILVSNQCNQTMSLVVDVIAWYTTFVEVWETIIYFLIFQEIRESMYIYIQNSMVDLRSSRSPMQLALEYAHNCKKKWTKVKDSKI